MLQLPACCTDPNCRTFQSMVLNLKVWGFDPTPRKENGRPYFEAAVGDNWTLRRRDRFEELVRDWPKGH